MTRSLHNRNIFLRRTVYRLGSKSIRAGAPFLLVLVSLYLNACMQYAQPEIAFIPPSKPTLTEIPSQATLPHWATPSTTPPVETLGPTVTPPSPHPTTSTMPVSSRIAYRAQSGDTLAVVASRFGTPPESIRSPDPIKKDGLLNPGQLLILPGELSRRGDFAPELAGTRLMPDSEVVYSPTVADFAVAGYLEQAGGFLSTYREYLRSTGWTSAADIINRVALENSIHPHLLISLLEYETNCVSSTPDESKSTDYLFGMTDFRRKGLYRQLSWAASQLSAGYYGWRAGTLTEFPLPGGIIARPAPDLNAGSVAVQYFFAKLLSYNGGDYRLWEEAVDPQRGLPAMHAQMFGDPWQRAKIAEPLLPSGLQQPELSLPFEPGRLWSFISGPHTVWETEGAQAALDFAPATASSGCVPTKAWVVAVADGVVIRSEFGAVIQDISGDRREETGWTILYLHIDPKDRVEPGTFLVAGDRIGHPSCEGGRANGTHVHIARKYNGEWIPAGGPLPFELSGWVAHNGEKPYEGTMTQGDRTVVAHPYGSFETHIFIPKDES